VVWFGFQPVVVPQIVPTAAPVDPSSLDQPLFVSLFKMLTPGATVGRSAFLLVSPHVTKSVTWSDERV